MAKKFKNLNLKLRTKIIYMLILVSLVAVGSMGIVSYFSARHVISNKLEMTSRQTIQEVTKGIDNYISALGNMLEVLSKDQNMVEIDTALNLEYGKQMIANMTNTDTNILNMYVGSEKGTFYTYPEISIDASFDHKTRDWYTKALANTDKLIVSKPYMSANTNKMVATLSKAVISNGQVTGVVGMDIDLEFFSKDITNVSIGRTGFIYITDADGIMLAYSDPNVIGSDAISKQDFWSDVETNKEGFLSYSYQGVDSFGAFYTSNFTGWKVIASMDMKELTDDTNIILYTFYVVLAIIVILSILVSILFSNPIAKNIKLLNVALEQVSKGNLMANVNLKAKDEFKSLGQNFNLMIENMSNLIRHVQASSQMVQESSTMLSAMSQETNLSVNEVAKAIEEVATGAFEQAKNSLEGATNINELATRLNHIDESTLEITDLSSNATDLIELGLTKMELLNHTTNTTKESTKKIADLVYDMNESMKQIHAISDTITSITAQTNLLALNASIEAARAGEAGKGFAVVADEIRNLADQSKSSTVQIKKILDEIQNKTSNSVEAMNQTESSVTNQVSVVEEAQTVFHDIMNGISNLSTKIIEIKDFTHEISNKKEELIIQMESISSIAEESASATEEVTATTEEISVTMDEVSLKAKDLNELSNELQNNINKFKILK